MIASRPWSRSHTGTTVRRPSSSHKAATLPSVSTSLQIASLAVKITVVARICPRGHRIQGGWERAKKQVRPALLGPRRPQHLQQGPVRAPRFVRRDSLAEVVQPVGDELVFAPLV